MKTKGLKRPPSNEVLEMALFDLLTELADAFENLGEALFDVRDRLVSPDSKFFKK